MSLANPARQTRIPSERGDQSMQRSVQGSMREAGRGTLEQAGPDGAPGQSEITFIRPIPGFAGLSRFVLVRLDGEDSAISELRSLESPDVRFVVAAPGMFFSDYVIELDDDDCEHLGLTVAEDALILTVLTIGSDASTSTANLLAPMIINVRTKAAAQIILAGSDWPVRAPLG